MQLSYTKGDKKSFTTKVKETDIAAFETGVVHKSVYATFALARDAEWVCRLFVLDMKENHEEGIGTKLHIEHISPALVGDDLNFEAEYFGIEEGHIICHWTCRCNDRLIAKGYTGQKILPKEKLQKIFQSIV